MARYRRVYVNVSRIQEGYYRLAKLDALAARIRTGNWPRRADQPSDQPAGQPADQPASSATEVTATAETATGPLGATTPLEDPTAVAPRAR